METASNPVLVVMGVAGCGKSSLGTALADSLGLLLIEGDDHHSADSREKMRQGTPLTDADRAGWLAALANLLAGAQDGVVLTCSALRRTYRDQLRAATPGLRFVFLDILPSLARERVAARSAHFFATSLVDSQFATLESPAGEPGVLVLDGARPLDELRSLVLRWVAGAPNQPVRPVSEA